MDVTFEWEFVKRMTEEYPPAAAAFANPSLPQGPLLDWLSTKGYKVDVDFFGEDIAALVRRRDDPEEIVSLTTAATFPLALHQAVRELMPALSEPTQTTGAPS